MNPRTLVQVVELCQALVMKADVVDLESLLRILDAIVFMTSGLNDPEF